MDQRGFKRVVTQSVGTSVNGASSGDATNKVHLDVEASANGKGFIGTVKWAWGPIENPGTLNYTLLCNPSLV